MTHRGTRVTEIIEVQYWVGLVEPIRRDPSGFVEAPPSVVERLYTKFHREDGRRVPRTNRDEQAPMWVTQSARLAPQRPRPDGSSRPLRNNQYPDDEWRVPCST